MFIKVQDVDVLTFYYTIDKNTFKLILFNLFRRLPESKMARIFLKTRCSIKNFDKIDIRGLSTLKGQKLAATNAVWDNWNESQILDEKVEKYSVYHPTPISIAHFINFGKKETGESSFLFLKRELPVR